MTKMVVDGAERRLDAVWTNWSDMLDAVDRELAAYGRIVTSVRLDGIDVPAFRDASVAGRALAGFAVIEVQSGTEADLVGRCLSDAIDAIDALRQSAADVGAAFRKHDLQPANGGLKELAGGLSTLMSLLQAIGLALRVDLTAARDGHPSPATLIAELAGHVEGLIAAQSNQDWLTVADVIEYDVEPSLRRWHDLFSSFAPAPEPLRVAV